MRTLVLYLPRLGIQLARREDPASVGRPLALLAGKGDGALVAGASVEATLSGIECGMTAMDARHRCPGIAFQADNARQCLERLEALTDILRTRATTSVAIVSRNAIGVSLAGLEARFADEGSAAHAIVALARSWSGFDVRAGVADNLGDALGAARSARRFPVLEQGGSHEPDSLPSYEPVACSFHWPAPVSTADADARLGRMLGGLQPLLAEYGHSYRAVRVELERGAHHRSIVLRPEQPIHRAAEALELLRARLEPAQLEGVTRLRVQLELPGPSVEVEPRRNPVARVHEMVPAVPVQRRLLRAS